MFRYHVSPCLTQKRVSGRPNKEKKEQKLSKSQAKSKQWLAQTSSPPLELIPVRRWRPAQQEVIEQLRQDGLISQTGSGSKIKEVRNGSGSRMHEIQGLAGRLERVPMGGSRLDERIELARLLREKRLWSCGTMARQGRERKGRIVDSQNKLQEERRRRLDEKMRDAKERKLRLMEERVAQSRRNEYSGWGYLP